MPCQIAILSYIIILCIRQGGDADQLPDAGPGAEWSCNLLRPPQRELDLGARRVRADSLFEAPAARNLYETTYLAGLRKAGMPEE